jgi:hypothetical protein
VVWWPPAKGLDNSASSSQPETRRLISHVGSRFDVRTPRASACRIDDISSGVGWHESGLEAAARAVAVARAVAIDFSSRSVESEVKRRVPTL